MWDGRGEVVDTTLVSSQTLNSYGSGAESRNGSFVYLAFTIDIIVYLGREYLSRVSDCSFVFALLCVCGRTLATDSDPAVVQCNLANFCRRLYADCICSGGKCINLSSVLLILSQGSFWAYRPDGT